jgi:hypothetical protein
VRSATTQARSKGAHVEQGRRKLRCTDAGRPSATWSSQQSKPDRRSGPSRTTSPQDLCAETYWLCVSDCDTPWLPPTARCRYSCCKPGSRLPRSVLDAAIHRGELPEGVDSFPFEEVVGAAVRTVGATVHFPNPRRTSPMSRRCIAMSETRFWCRKIRRTTPFECRGELHPRGRDST